jgi:hypothetical protein
VAWVRTFRYGGDGKLLWRGYATRLDGDKVEAVSASFLSSKDTVRSYAEASTPDKLWAWGSNGNDPLFVNDVFFGEIPSKEQLLAYYAGKHGNLRGLDWLFPRRIQNSAAIEWVEEQLQQEHATPRRESELNGLRDNLRRASDQASAEKKILGSKGEYAERPQPIDYGLTYDDLNLYDRLGQWWRLNDGSVVQCRGTRIRPDEKYKKGWRWFRVLHPLHARADKAGGFAFLALLIGGLIVGNQWSSNERLPGLLVAGFGLACVPFAIVPGVLLKRLRTRASPGLKAYWQAVDRYDKEKAAAEEAARAAARDAELRKRSYWTFLDGYAFERATAEVLNKHQFNAIVTPGSGDGGVDIVVTRNGLKGVVQCKAHVACVGPHVVRDLYGVIHHCGAAFGIIVSLGGFTRGATDFARDKPILFLDVSDLIAMQEGRDVLAGEFTRTDS